APHEAPRLTGGTESLPCSVQLQPDELRRRTLDLPGGQVRVGGPDRTLGVEVDLARVGDTRRKRVDREVLRGGIEAHEGLRLGGADPDRVGPPVDVEGVGCLAAPRLDGQLPGVELPRARIEAGEDTRAEAGNPEVATRIEAEAARRAERGVDHPDVAALGIEPADAMRVQLAEPHPAIRRDVDAVGDGQLGSVSGALWIEVDGRADPEEPGDRAHGEALLPGPCRQEVRAAFAGRGVEHRDLVRYRQRVPDPAAAIEAQRVRIEPLLLRVDVEVLGAWIEVGELVAEAEGDPHRPVARYLQAVGRDVRVGVDGNRPLRGEDPAER